MINKCWFFQYFCCYGETNSIGKQQTLMCHFVILLDVSCAVVQLLRTPYGNRTFRPFDVSPPGRFAPSQDVSPPGLSSAPCLPSPQVCSRVYSWLMVYSLDVSPLGRFAPWTFRHQDISPPGRFAPVRFATWTFRPRLWTFRPRLLFYVF